MRSISKLKVFAILIFLIYGTLLCSQNLEYNVEKPTNLYLGTPFKVNVNIETALNDSIFAPKLDTLDVFIRTGEIIQSEEILENKKISHLTLRFQGFDTGEFTFPAMEFLVKKENGTKVTLTTNEFLLNISSTIADSSQMIKDISSPVKIGFTFWDYLLPTLLLIVIIASIVILRKYLKKEPEKIEKTIIKDTRPPWQICLELLGKLQKENLLGKGDFLEFYYRLSIILRYFIELYYHVRAVEMTTSEIRQTLQLNDHKEKSKILEILSYSDRVKFAKFSPTFKDSEENFIWLEGYLKSFKNAETLKEENNA